MPNWGHLVVCFQRAPCAEILNHLAHDGHMPAHVEVDAGVKLQFHGAETLGQVSPEKWAEFTLRVQTLRRLCASRV